MKNLIFLSFLLPACAFARPSSTTSEGQKFTFEKLLKRDEVVWGLDFLPDGRLLFTERGGKMGIFDEKSKKTIELTGGPRVHVAGQGGLLDVRVHPDHSKNHRIFFTYSEPVGEESTTALASGELKGNTLVNVKKLFSASKPNGNDHHYGSRIAFDGKGHVFFTVGDRGIQDDAQNLKLHLGKIIRLNEDGSVPKDNPFVGRKDALPEIWSLGHRSPQGLVFHPDTHELWEAEMGPQGGDEVNLIRPGKNYGWPVITYGREYSGPKIGEGVAKAGMEQPLVHWVPSISPSAITFYTGTVFPKWKGDLFVANLSSQHLRRLKMDGKKVVKQEELLREEGQRFRQVRTGPEGFLYVTTDEGLIGRIKPLNSSP